MPTNWEDFEAVDTEIDWSEFEPEPETKPIGEGLPGQRMNLPAAIQGIRESRIGGPVFGKEEAEYKLEPGAALKNIMESPVMPEIYTPGVSYVPGMVKTPVSPFAPVEQPKYNVDEGVMKPLIDLVPENPAFAPAVVNFTSDPNISEEERFNRISRLRGVTGSLRDTVNFFTSPFGISTLGIGAMPKAAQSAIAASFALHMGSQVPELARELGTELGKPEAERDQEKIANLVTTAATTTGFTALAGAHAAKPGIERLQERREAFLGAPAVRPEPRYPARTTEVGIEAPPGFGEPPTGVITAPAGIPIEAPRTVQMTRQETARQAAIRKFNDRLEEMRFKAPKPTVPEGPQIGAPLATQATPGMRPIRELSTYEDFAADLVDKVTPDMTVKQVQELYPAAFKRGDVLVNKEAAGELLSDAKKAAHPIDWMEQELEAGKRVSTESAYDIGLKARSIDDLERLTKYAEETIAQNREAAAKKDVKTLFKPRNMQVQIPREAVEAALGVGSAKTHPGLPANRPLDVRLFPEAREWWRKNAKRFGEDIERKRKEEFGETAAEPVVETPKPSVTPETVKPVIQPEVTPAPAPAESGSFIGLPRNKWTLQYLEGLGITGRAPVIRQAIAALKDVGGKTKLGENATPQTLLKAVNEIMDLRAKKAEKTVPVYHGEGGPGGAGLGGFSVSENPEYAAAFGPKQSVVEVPESVLEKMKEEARQRGEPTNLILPEEYQKKLRPVEKPIEPPVTETSFITKEAVEASKGNLTPDEVDELGRLLTAEELGMLDQTQESRLSELRKKSEAPQPAEPPSLTKPQEITAPARIPAETPSPVRLPQVGEELISTTQKPPTVDTQRKAITGILEKLETEDKFGNLQPNKKLSDADLESLSLDAANAIGVNWSETIGLDHSELIKIVRDRLRVIETAKREGKTVPEIPQIQQPANKSIARLGRELKLLEEGDSRTSPSDILDRVEEWQIDFPDEIPDYLKQSAKEYRDAIDEARAIDDVPIEISEKFLTDAERAVYGKIQRKPAPKTIAEEEGFVKPDKAYFEQFRDLEARLESARKEAAAATEKYEKIKATKAAKGRAAGERIKNLTFAAEDEAAAKRKLSDIQRKYSDLRINRQVEFYDWSEYISKGKELPPDREINYGGETKPPVTETVSPVPETKPTPVETKPAPVTPEPVTPPVTEKPAEVKPVEPEAKPDRGLYGSEDFELLSVKRGNVKAEIEKLNKDLLDLEAEHTALYKANAPEKKMTLNREKRTEAKRKILEKEAELRNIEGSIGLARMRSEAAEFKGKPVAAGTQNITNKILKAQKDELLSKIDEAIKSAPTEGTEKITIEVEGDGVFTITNTKDSLKNFKGIADKQFPSTVGGIPEPGLPSGEPRGIPAAKNPKPDDISKIAGSFVSEDKTREAIQTAYADGTQIIATDGRTLIRIVTDKAPGKPNAPVRINKKGGIAKDVEGKFPDWRQIRDEKAELIYGGLDTKELAHIAHQAKALRDTSVTDKDKRNSHSVELFVNKDRSLGGKMDVQGDLYEHNVQPGAIRLGHYNPDYIAEAMIAARKLGNEKVDVYAHSGETGPIAFVGKNHESLVMPMRMGEGKGFDREPAPKFLSVSGKATHGQLPIGYGPLENPRAPLTEYSEAASGKYQTTVEGDTIKFEEIKTRKDYRGNSETFTETVAEIDIDKFPEGEKSQKLMVQEAIEPYTGKTNVKTIANALVRDAQKALARRREIERTLEQRGKEATQVMPPGPGAASPSEFAQREARAGTTPPTPPPTENPGVAVEGGNPLNPEIVRANADFNIINRLNSGQFSFYFGRLGEMAKAAWERMAIGEFRMREAIKRDIQMLVDEPLKKLPREFRKEGGKAFFDAINGRKMEAIEAEFEGKPGGQVIIDEVRKVKTRLEEIRTTIRNIKRESYNSYLMGLEKEMLEKLYQENINPDTGGKNKQGLADALTMDQFPDDWGIADGSYLPHLFFGQWKITAQIPGFETPQFITRAKTPSEAKARIFELTQRNPEYKNANFTIEQDMMIPADMIRLGDGNFWRLMKQMKDRAQGEIDPKEAVHGIIGRKTSKQKWFGSLQQRQGFENYSKDYRQVMTAYLNGFQRWKELTAMNREVQPMIEAVKREGRVNAAGRLTDILETLWGKPSQLTLDFDALMREIPVVRDIVKPMALDRWSRMLNTIVTNLTLRTIRFSTVNRLQPLQGLYPLIGEKLLVKAKKLQHSAEGRKLLDDAGVTFDTGQYTSEISAGTKFEKVVERFTGEQSNQELAFLGMYLHGLEKGMGKPQAIRYAKLRGQLLTQFSPLLVDVPPIMEGPIGRVTFQFKRFPVKQMELLASMVADRNIPGLARWFAVMALSGGLALMLKQIYSDKESRMRVKRMLNKSVGEKQADYIFYGLPGLIGADLSGSLVLGDEPFGENFYEKLGRTVMGPAPSLAYETGKAISTEPREAMSTTERITAIARRIPSLRQIVEMKDLIDGNVDVTSPDGEIKYRRKVRDVILGMGSFRSSNEANIQLAVSAVIELKKEVAGLKNAYWVASQSGDNSKISDAKQAVKDFNERWPEIAITPSELERYFSTRKSNQPKTDVEKAVGKKYSPLLPR